MPHSDSVIWPGISVVLAVRNEAEHLDDCLTAISELDYPSDRLEILLIDGESVDATPSVLRAWAERDSRFRILQNQKRNVAAGVNIGIRESRFDLLLWTSGHVLLQPDHLKTSVSVMNVTGAAAVGGVLNTQGTTEIGKVNAAVLSHPFGVGGGEHRVGARSGWVPLVTMALYRKAALVAVGGFDEQLPRNQDNDLHHRLEQAGHRSYLDVNINPTYLCRNTLGGLLKQAWRNGFWSVVMTRSGYGGFRLHHYVPMIFVGGQVALVAAGLFYRPLWWLLAALMALYMLLAIVSAVTISIRRKFSWQLPLIPFWFAALHYTYGIASWVGSFSPKLRRK